MIYILGCCILLASSLSLTEGLTDGTRVKREGHRLQLNPVNHLDNHELQIHYRPFAEAPHKIKEILHYQLANGPLVPIPSQPPLQLQPVHHEPVLQHQPVPVPVHHPQPQLHQQVYQAPALPSHPIQHNLIQAVPSKTYLPPVSPVVGPHHQVHQPVHQVHQPLHQVHQPLHQVQQVAAQYAPQVHYTQHAPQQPDYKAIQVQVKQHVPAHRPAPAPVPAGHYNPQYKTNYQHQPAVVPLQHHQTYLPPPAVGHQGIAVGGYQQHQLSGYQRSYSNNQLPLEIKHIIHAQQQELRGPYHRLGAGFYR